MIQNIRFPREKFLDNLKHALKGSNKENKLKIPWKEILGNKTSNYELKVWREFDSERDTITPRELDINKYLQSLLNGEGG